MDAEAIDYRQQRGFAIANAKGKHIKRLVDHMYLVPSQTQTSGSYVVDTTKASCTCPDFETRGPDHRCKHLWAVLIVRREVAMPDGSTVVTEKRITYAQNWPAYRAARTKEKELFEQLLRALCDGVVQPTYKGNGRPALPLADVIFAGGLKVFTTYSGDRATSDIRSAKQRGLTDVVPHPNTVFRILRMPETVPVLRRLIEQSAMPLRTVESDFAADGTGIATKNYVRWFDHKWGKERREQQWVKLHMMIGVRTQIITAAEVTPGTMNDSPFLPALIDATAKNFNMQEVAADKGYLSRENFRAITKVGAEPFIPFKPNSRADEKDALWTRLHAFYTFNRPTFLQHYHKRSLTEATFSSIKRVLGSAVRAKTFEGQVSEVYLKVLCHNLRVLVQSIFELGIEPTFWAPPTVPQVAS